MTTPTTVRQSRAIPVAVGTAFEAALSLPLPQLYRRRYGPMPPIVEVQEQQGPWQTPGQTRVFVTSDGGRMREEMLTIDPPREFSKPADGARRTLPPDRGHHRGVLDVPRGRYGHQGDLDWNLYPRSAFGALLVPVVARLWRGYARGVLEQLSDEVLR